MNADRRLVCRDSEHSESLVLAGSGSDWQSSSVRVGARRLRRAAAAAGPGDPAGRSALKSSVTVRRVVNLGPRRGHREHPAISHGASRVPARRPPRRRPGRGSGVGLGWAGRGSSGQGRLGRRPAPEGLGQSRPPSFPGTAVTSPSFRFPSLTSPVLHVPRLSASAALRQAASIRPVLRWPGPGPGPLQPWPLGVS